MEFALHGRKLCWQIFEQLLLGSTLAHDGRHLFAQVAEDEHMNARRSNTLHELIHLHTCEVLTQLRVELKLSVGSSSTLSKSGFWADFCHKCKPNTFV